MRTPTPKPDTATITAMLGVWNIAEANTSQRTGHKPAEIRTLARFQAMQDAGARVLNATLAAAIGEDTQSICRSASSLRKKGLLIRLPGKSIQVTGEGRKVLAAYRKELARAIDRLQNIA